MESRIGPRCNPQVKQRLNSPTPQLAPVAWAIVCGFGVVVFVSKLFEFPPGSSGWQGGIAGIVLCSFGFVAIEVWWLASQREIAVDSHGITIRSWLEALARLPGSAIPWDAMRAANLVFDAGRKLEITTTRQRYVYWVAIWNPSMLVDLLRIVDDHGVPTRMDWIPGE